jgi:hypothetical protein
VIVFIFGEGLNGIAADGLQLQEVVYFSACRQGSSKLSASNEFDTKHKAPFKH